MGFAAVIIGAAGADPNGDMSGASYVIFGKGVELNVSDASVTERNAGTTVLQFYRDDYASLAAAGPEWRIPENPGELLRVSCDDGG